jgi:hypothetical protein
MITMLLSSPMLLQSDPNTTLYTYDGQRGLMEHDKDSDRWEIKLMVSSKILVQVAASAVKNADPAEAYLKAIDLKGLQKAFSG